MFNIAATYTENPDVLRSITLAFLPEGTHTLLSSYIYNIAKRRGIEVTFESSTVTLIVQNRAESFQRRFEFETKLATEVALRIASDTGCPKLAKYEIMRISGEGESISNIKYSKLGKGLFSVLCKTDKGFLYILMKLHCPVRVLVTRRPISYGQTIYPQDLEWREVNLYDINGTPASTDDAYYSKTSRFLRAGEVLTLESIKRKPDAYKGQVVLAYVELPGVKVTAFVRLLHDAYIGDVVRVENITSGRILIGVLEKGPVVKILEVGR